MRFLHAPLHGPDAVANIKQITARIRKIDPDVTSLTEAYTIGAPLGRMVGRRIVLEGGGADARRGQHDNPLLVRDSLTSRGSGQVFGCGKSLPDRIAPERWFTFSTVDNPDRKKGRPVTTINLHPHAAIQDAKTGKPMVNVDRVKKFAQQMDRLDALLGFFGAWSDLTIIGDMNYRDHDGWDHSPYVIMRAHGLHIATVGIDAIAASTNLKLKIHEVTGAGTDHPWIVGETS